MYTLRAVQRKGKKCHVYYFDGKSTFSFEQILTNFEINNHINGNALDLREQNLIGRGKNINANDNDQLKLTEIKNIKDMSKYYYMNDNDLPENKWILGNINENALKQKVRKEKIPLICPKKENMYKKNSDLDENNLNLDNKLMTTKYLINISHTLKLVTNQIRILDKNIIEINGTHGITIIDRIFLPLFLPRINHRYSNVSLHKKSFQGNEYIYMLMLVFDYVIVIVHII